MTTPQRDIHRAGEKWHAHLIWRWWFQTVVFIAQQHVAKLARAFLKSVGQLVTSIRSRVKRELWVFLTNWEVAALVKWTRPSSAAFSPASEARKQDSTSVALAYRKPNVTFLPAIVLPGYSPGLSLQILSCFGVCASVRVCAWLWEKVRRVSLVFPTSSSWTRLDEFYSRATCQRVSSRCTFKRIQYQIIFGLFRVMAPCLRGQNGWRGKVVRTCSIILE